MTNTAKTPRNALITGMPRSGTSMTAAIFARSGYFLAHDESTELQGPDRFNPNGYWEAKAVVNANRMVLKRAGYAFDNTWMFDAITKSQADLIWELSADPADIGLCDRYHGQAPWVWKDPRFCYTLGYWWKLLDPARTAVLLLTRNPDEIQRSFQRVRWREDLEPTLLNRCISDHIARARETIGYFGIPCLEIDYSEFASSPDVTAAKIGDFFGVSLSAGDLGYVHSRNSSTLGGRVRNGFESLRCAVPDPIRRTAKRILRRR